MFSESNHQIPLEWHSLKHQTAKKRKKNLIRLLAKTFFKKQTTTGEVVWDCLETHLWTGEIGARSLWP